MQRFDFQITEPASLLVQSNIKSDTSMLELNLSGAKLYYIQFNQKIHEVRESSWSAELTKGPNLIKVWTDQACQGNYYKEIFQSENIRCYPNPCEDELQVYVAGQDDYVEIQLMNLQGGIVYKAHKQLGVNRVVQLVVSDLKSGIYLVQVKGNTVNQEAKIVKK